jgi:hypothetical protein
MRKGAERDFVHQKLSLNGERFKYIELPDIAKKRTQIGLVPMEKTSIYETSPSGERAPVTRMSAVTNGQDRQYEPKKENTVPRIIKDIKFA